MHPGNTVVLAGLDSGLAAELAIAVEAAGVSCRVSGLETLESVVKTTRPGIVFCGCEEASYTAALGVCGKVPVVVATRTPEVREWLDAMDRGASDYCAAPFEPEMVKWLLASNLRARRAEAA